MQSVRIGLTMKHSIIVVAPREILVSMFLTLNEVFTAQLYNKTSLVYVDKSHLISNKVSA